MVQEVKARVPLWVKVTAAVTYLLLAACVSAVLLAACASSPKAVTRTVIKHETVTRVVIKWKIRTVTKAVSVQDPGLIQCATQLWGDWANRAPVAASMGNVVGQYAPGCMPYLREITP